MDYREYQISELLTEYVQLIWSMESESGSEPISRERIMPDGIVELVFHYRAPLQTYRADGSSYVQPDAFVISQMRQFIEIEPTGDVGFTSVRFYPWGAYHFFDHPIKEFLDDYVDAGTIWPAHYPALANRFRQSESGEDRKQLVESFLIDRLNDHRRQDGRVDQSLKQIRGSGGRETIAELSQQLKITEKQLQRLYVDSIGTTPKVFSRVSRFLYLCHHLSEFREKSLTEVAHFCGFFDQSHFIHEFKQFSGFTPTQFFERDDVGFADL